MQGPKNMARKDILTNKIDAVFWSPQLLNEVFHILLDKNRFQMKQNKKTPH